MGIGFSLNIKTIIIVDIVWTGFTSVEVVGGTVVVRITTIVAPIRLVLLVLMVLVMVPVLQSHGLGGSHQKSGCN